MASKNEVRAGDIVISVLVTILWGVIFCIFFYFNYAYHVNFSRAFDTLWMPTVIYLLLHPLIGKMWYWIVHSLCYVIDYTYNLKDEVRWSNWSKGWAMKFAAWWPISGPIGFIITFIGSLFGLIFRGLFK